MCIDPPSLPFPTAAIAPTPRNAPTVSSTTEAHVCEDMSWEPSSEPAVMDMDTTPPSEAVILRSPPESSMPFAFGHSCATVPTGTPALTVPCPNPFGNNLRTPGTTDGQRQSMSSASASGLRVDPGLVPALPSMVAITPSHPPMDFESIDTTPPSQAVLLHSRRASELVSTRLLAQAVWGSTAAFNHTGAPSQPTCALLNRKQQPAGRVILRNPLSSAATAGLTVPTGQPASGSKTQLGFGIPNPNVHRSPFSRFYHCCSRPHSLFYHRSPYL
ncbi:nuclear pore-associated protein 1-like [Nannospalax galili]|uniref:nuclear pore-associated protein 1-like n=1 Tax=Nannospalax galili TaxID=1026970 RepID=UPI00081A0D82|nr:nuclear pore-associated protein 1-like [Nannospalax galili]